MGESIFGSNADEVGKMQASLEDFADGCSWMLSTSHCVVILFPYSQVNEYIMLRGSCCHYK